MKWKNTSTVFYPREFNFPLKTSLCILLGLCCIIQKGSKSFLRNHFGAACFGVANFVAGLFWSGPF